MGHIVVCVNEDCNQFCLDDLFRVNVLFYRNFMDIFLQTMFNKLN